MLFIAEVFHEGVERPAALGAGVHQRGVHQRVAVLLHGRCAGQGKVVLGAVQEVELRCHGAAEHRPFVSHQAIQVPFRRLHRSGFRRPAAQVHLDVVVGRAEDDVHAGGRGDLQLEFAAVGVGVRIGGDGVDADDLEGLVVLVVVVVERAVEDHQAVQLAGLKAHFEGVELLGIVAHGGVVVVQGRV